METMHPAKLAGSGARVRRVGKSSGYPGVAVKGVIDFIKALGPRGQPWAP
jgi:hypothetical protein